jgi:hypothetical protein
MGCLDNLIGIKTCDITTGSSPYYIEDIGITVTEADQYINNNYASGQEFLEDKIRYATQLVRDLITNHFSSSIVTKSLISSQVLGNYQDSLQLKSGVVNTLGGIALTLNNPNSYFNVFVNSISLQLSTTENVDVLVYDLVSGTLLDTIVVECVANTISTTVVNKTYSSPKRKLDLIFVYDTEGLNSNTTQLSYSDCGSCTGWTSKNYYVSATPISLLDSATKIRSSLTSSSHTFGLSVNYSIQCAFDNWICEIANLMALPVLYKTGMEVMEYAANYSNRQTSTINIDYERNQRRMESYTAKFNDSLQATVQNIVLPQYDKCFVCNDSVMLKIALP